MTEIPAELAAVIKSGDLRQLKVFCTFYRNKWDAEQNVFKLEETPLDITEQVVKWGTLSTKLDVGEISEFTASNMTLTLSDPHNHFVEETPESYFPAGYQIYGSRVDISCGTETDKTPLFSGVIKTLPNYTPEKYQLSLTLVSPLELLNDVEAKEYSDKVVGEVLTLDHKEDDNQPVYKTANLGVGGFNAVYANGVKLYEGVDYEVSNVNEANSVAFVQITKADFYSANITADYYCWKRNKSIENILNELLQVAGYQVEDMDISSVSFNSQIRSEKNLSALASLGFIGKNGNYIEDAGNHFFWGTVVDNNFNQPNARTSIFPNRFIINLSFGGNHIDYSDCSYVFGDLNSNLTHNGWYNLQDSVVSGLCLYKESTRIFAYWRLNGQTVRSYEFSTRNYSVSVEKNGNNYSVTINGITVSQELDFEMPTNKKNEGVVFDWRSTLSSFSLTALDNNGSVIAVLDKPALLLMPQTDNSSAVVWSDFKADFSNKDIQYTTLYRISNDNVNWGNWIEFDSANGISVNSVYIQFLTNIVTHPPNASTDIDYPRCYFLSDAITLNFIDLSGQTVLDVIKDLALISGYEFGIDRNNVFFFRPRTTSTTPVYILDEKELVKIDTVQRDVKELATKITLNFAAIPLEFYANTGDRPTAVDRYGVINRDIDKPQIINYDNPELAQAIGPQLLAIYSALSNTITCTGKFNLSLELGDVVNLQREMPLTVPPNYADYTKYERLNTFYRACKITGLNYDFAKRQIKYTLRDVSNKNNAPEKEFYEYQTIFPTPLDYKE